MLDTKLPIWKFLTVVNPNVFHAQMSRAMTPAPLAWAAIRSFECHRDINRHLTNVK